MSLLKKAKQGEDIDVSSESGVGSASGRSLETLYEKLFSKIGRDFLHVEDFQRIIVEILEHIDPSLVEEIDLYSMESAMLRATEYKDFLESDIDGSTVYEDLINLDEDS